MLLSDNIMVEVPNHEYMIRGFDLLTLTQFITLTFIVMQHHLT